MTGKARGRPRQFDADTVLEQAVGVFSARGFSATSLDDLAHATGLNRPSLYNAFGDKEALYLQALGHFVARLRRTLEEAVMAEPDLATALGNLYRGALDAYFAVDPAPGCFVFCTAPVEALAHPAVRELTLALVNELDRLLGERFASAKEAGQLPPGLDPVQTAKLAQAALHTLAIRARAGESRASLQRFATHTVALLAPSPVPRRARAPRRRTR
ncbi:MAG: TetR/AcrR family transcriptional regulator [Gammaproteobacteria bacterium]